MGFHIYRRSICRSWAARLRSVWLPLACLLLFASGARGQQSQSERSSIAKFIQSTAATVYKIAWPTARFNDYSIDDFEISEHGADVIVKLSGYSGFDGSDLWIKLDFVFRSGEFTGTQVRDHNGNWPPFATAKMAGTVLASLADEYAKDRDRQQQQQPPGQYPMSPAPPPPPAPAQTVPAPPSESYEQPPQAAYKPDYAAPESAPPAPVAPAWGTIPRPSSHPMQIAANDVRAYLSAARGGFASMTAGPPRVTANGARLWPLRQQPGVQTSCYAFQQSPQLIVCLIRKGSRAEVDSMANELVSEVQDTLPAGWFLKSPRYAPRPGSDTYAELVGPNASSAQIANYESQTAGVSWLEFEIRFAQ